jgi:ribonuclease E
LIIPEYIIDVKNKSKKTLELIEHYEKLKNLEQQKKDENIIELKDKKKFKKKPFRKKKFYKKVK